MKLDSAVKLTTTIEGDGEDNLRTLPAGIYGYIVAENDDNTVEVEFSYIYNDAYMHHDHDYIDNTDVAREHLEEVPEWLNTRVKDSYYRPMEVELV